MVGYEITLSSWGYLMERASHLNINLTHDLSRVNGSNDVLRCTHIKHSLTHSFIPTHLSRLPLFYPHSHHTPLSPFPTQLPYPHTHSLIPILHPTPLFQLPYTHSPPPYFIPTSTPLSPLSYPHSSPALPNPHPHTSDTFNTFVKYSNIMY